jgi:tRNA-Thr(GGU) m(6)t(6)A37 methyltransferase TsaA
MELSIVSPELSVETKMKNELPPPGKDIVIRPIGIVRGAGKNRRIELYETYRPGLEKLEYFSHLIVLWWADRRDDPKHRAILRTRPPYAKKILTGIFATRAEYRPNPVAVTVCRIIAVDRERGRVEVSGLDAREGTPVVDLKAYFPCCDRVREARTPDWLPRWPDWVPE